MIYSPNEPRDARGRWTKGANSEDDYARTFYPSHPNPRTPPIVKRWAGQTAPSITLASSNGGIRHNVFTWVKRFFGGDFGDGEINSILDQMNDDLGFFGAMGLSSIEYGPDGIAMSQDQFDTIMESASKLQPPDLAARFKKSVAQAIKSGTLRIR